MRALQAKKKRPRRPNAKIKQQAAQAKPKASGRDSLNRSDRSVPIGASFCRHRSNTPPTKTTDSTLCHERPLARTSSSCHHRLDAPPAMTVVSLSYHYKPHAPCPHETMGREFCCHMSPRSVHYGHLLPPNLRTGTHIPDQVPTHGVKIGKKLIFRSIPLVIER